jgi:hypothetical protein
MEDYTAGICSQLTGAENELGYHPSPRKHTKAGSGIVCENVVRCPTFELKNCYIAIATCAAITLSSQCLPSLVLPRANSFSITIELHQLSTLFSICLFRLLRWEVKVVAADYYSTSLHSVLILAYSIDEALIQWDRSVVVNVDSESTKENSLHYKPTRHNFVELTLRVHRQATQFSAAGESQEQRFPWEKREQVEARIMSKVQGVPELVLNWEI